MTLTDSDRALISSLLDAHATSLAKACRHLSPKSDRDLLQAWREEVERSKWLAIYVFGQPGEINIPRVRDDVS